MRPCPTCDALGKREELFHYTLTSGHEQYIWLCCCGMIYAQSTAVNVDYASASTYSRPGAIGDGLNPHDHRRHIAIMEVIERMGFGHDAAVCDYGCGQGGLLDTLRAADYTNLTGFDLSPSCCVAIEQKGYKVLPQYGNEKFDLITLSHVLEHVPEPKWLLRGILSRLKQDGSVYVEVPDAARYNIPFLDFNSEHINHFDTCSLRKLLDSVGLFGGIVQEKWIELNDGSPYPALWTITRRSRTAIHMSQYIEKSRASLIRARARLLADLAGCDRIIVWGAGEYLAHVLPLLEGIDILAIVDSNPQLHGKVIAGIAVDHPSHILRLPNAPIVISAIIAAPAIKLAAEKLQVNNRVIALEIK